MIKIIIAGGRDFNDYESLVWSCDNIISCLPDNHSIEIVCGKAAGADALGEQYAKERGFSIKYFPADWKRYGKSAGPIRNKEMADYSHMLIAFWDKKSKGTSNMISIALEKLLDIKIINY